MTASRVEFGKDEVPPLQFQCTAGTLPTDLQGHVFIAAPVGFVDAPYGKGTPVFNGDGMTYRIDFDQPGVACLHSRIARTPCFYADEATRTEPNYAKDGFSNLGFMRFSLTLGLRNELNTAFLPMPALSTNNGAATGGDRLLVTYDAGRPYELDPSTLELVTPVGSNKEWRGAAPLNFPFAPVLSTAHPAFDPFTQEVFTVNYGRSVGNLLNTIPFLFEADELPQEIEMMLSGFASLIGSQAIVQESFALFSGIFQGVVQPIQRFFEQVTGIDVQNFVYLIRWDGIGNLERWKLILSDGTSVKIEQSMHQIGVTKDYVVLMDTSFKVGLEQVLNNPFPESKEFEKFLRMLLTRPQLPDTTLYIVRRDQLKDGQHPALSDQEVTVVARKVVLPLESIHFLTDYDNPDGCVTLYISHNCATDVSEWVRGYDTAAYQPDQSLPDYLDGMLAIGQMDVNRLGRYKVQGDSGQVVDSKVIYDIDSTFGVGLYTYRDRLSNSLMPRHISDIYWHSWGFWEDLMPKFIFDLYRNYKYRAMSVDEIRRLPNQGKPVYLFRLNTDSMEISDRYQFPDGYIMSSPQFVPRRNGSDAPTDGYITCTVITPEGDELWIFDAAKLNVGPVCKLGHPAFKVGYSLHTAWLPQTNPHAASYCVSVKADYDPVIQQQPEKIKTLFREEIYPHFAS
jgi:carotenoid cleavage dioxygenase-like enzyme